LAWGVSGIVARTAVNERSGIVKIKEIMTTDFEMIDSTSTLYDAAGKMKSLNVGVLPIREGTKLIGLVTDRDIVTRGLAEQRDPSSTQVKDIITSQLVHCSENDSVEGACKLMEKHQVRRLVVTDKDGTPAGIVSLGDIAAKTKQDELAGEALEAISEPASPSR
jgi:CBS domain-containing protein